MLADVAALPSLRPEIELGGNGEQEAVKWVFDREDYVGHVLYQPLHWYNGYEYTQDTPVVAPGDILVHFPGYAGKKNAAMGRWLDYLDGEDGSEWNPPLNRTKYKHEIGNFWSRLRAGKEVLKEAEGLAGEEYPNVTNRAIIDGLTIVHNELQEVLKEKPFDDTSVSESVQKLKIALEAASKNQAAKAKAIEMEYAQDQAARNKAERDKEMSNHQATP